jgi:hypothetical protein
MADDETKRMSGWAKRLFRTGHNSKKSRPRADTRLWGCPRVIDYQPRGRSGYGKLT